MVAFIVTALLYCSLIYVHFMTMSVAVFSLSSIKLS